MRNRMKIVAVAALVSGLLGSLTTAWAQQFERPEDETFYKEYKNRIEVADLLGIKKQVNAAPTSAERVMNSLSNQYGVSPVEALLLEMKPLAEALDEKVQGTQFQKRLAYLGGLDSEGLRLRATALEKLGTGFASFEKCLQTKDKNDYRTAILQLDEAMPGLVGSKDIEWLSLTRFRKGYCHEQVGEYLEAVKAYDTAMDEWVSCGRSKNSQDYAYMRDTRRSLIDKGYTPEGGLPGGATDGGPSMNTSTSFVEGSEWEEWETSYKKMKKADQFKTPSPFASAHLLLWKQFGFFDGINKIDHGEQTPLQPFGKPWQIVRDGAKGILDLDGDGAGDLEVKILDGKATAVEVDDGTKQGPKYSLFLATGGQNQQWLGQQANFQNLGYYRPACYREGKLLGQKLILIDDNTSGSYGDARESRDGVLRKYPSFMELDAMILGKGPALPFSEIVGVGEKWYRVRIKDTHASALATRELNLESGTVSLAWDGPVQPVSLVIGEVRELQGAYFELAGGEPVTVPVGRYKVAVGKLESGKKANTRHAWIFPGRSEPFEVKAGEETVLEMGAPYDIDFETDDQGREFVVEGKSILIYDRLGALVGKISPEVVLPEVSIRNKESGSVLTKKEKTRLIDTEQYNKDSQAAWFMRDFVFEKNPNIECEAQLIVPKKHPLLGGPITSEWK